MTNYKQIPGVEMPFTNSEIATLKEHFGCETDEDLRQAAQRYQELFYLFGYVEDVPGVALSPFNLSEPMPFDRDCHMRLALAFAEVVLENLKGTGGFKLRYPEPARVGRKNRFRIPEEIAAILRNPEPLSQIQAAEELLNCQKIRLGISAKTLVKYFSEDEREREERLRQAYEDFKDIPVPSTVKVDHD